jgi:copper chaperone CopZ
MSWFNRKQESKIVELTVHDMRCAHCEASVKLALGNVNGVRRVKVNRRQKRAIVTLDPEHPAMAEELIAVLAASGYRAESAQVEGE